VSATVKRPLSQLIYARVQDGSNSPRLVTLHDHNQHARDVTDYGLAAAPEGRIIGLESYKGVLVGHTIVGYTWFIGPHERPSPLFFGDALAEIERFLWDEVDRQAPNDVELPFLLGVGQGAIMAIATAAAVPDLLSGVIAVNGFLPIVPGWAPPLAPLDGLPLLLVDPSAAPPETDGVLAGEALATTLTAWGGMVTRREAPAGAIPAEAMASWLPAQAIRRRPA
jgi:pimeloyl-ACP methyl ester carboxylesterase